MDRIHELFLETIRPQAAATISTARRVKSKFVFKPIYSGFNNTMKFAMTFVINWFKWSLTNIAFVIKRI